jgi:hypothetical protein
MEPASISIALFCKHPKNMIFLVILLFSGVHLLSGMTAAACQAISQEPCLARSACLRLSWAGARQRAARYAGRAAPLTVQVDTLARYGMYIHAADWAANIATFSAFDAKPLTQRRMPPAPHKSGRHTVTFLMTDGDNVQWLLNSFSAPTSVCRCNIFVTIFKKPHNLYDI